MESSVSPETVRSCCYGIPLAGRVAFKPTVPERMFMHRGFEADSYGLTVRLGRTARFHAWGEICRPFEVERASWRRRAAVFRVLVANTRLRRRLDWLRAGNFDDAREVRHRLPSAKGIEPEKLILLLDQMRIDIPYETTAGNPTRYIRIGSSGWSQGASPNDRTRT